MSNTIFIFTNVHNHDNMPPSNIFFQIYLKKQTTANLSHTRIRLGLSYLNQSMFTYNQIECDYGRDKDESATQTVYLLECTQYEGIRNAILCEL